MIQKEKTVAFTGYRTSKILRGTNDSNLLKVIAAETDKVVLSLCEKGFTTFLCGMAEGFDLISAEAVVKAQKQYPAIKLIAVIPFMGQELGYSPHDKQRYHDLFHKAADRVFVSDNYHDKAFYQRNDFLLDNCFQVVCYYDGQRSGTMYTVNRAVKRNIPIINIRELIFDYLYDETPIREKLKQFHFIKHVTFAGNRIILNDSDHTEIPYDNIESVDNVAANMRLVLVNGTIFNISTISNDIRITLPELNPSPLQLLWWKMLEVFRRVFYRNN